MIISSSQTAFHLFSSNVRLRIKQMRRLCFGFIFHNKDRLDFKPSLFFLTNQLSICTISGMETREDLIKATIRGLLRIAKMYSRIEALPIPVDENLEVTTREAHTIEAVGEHEQMSVTQVASHLGITNHQKRGFADGGKNS